VPPDVALDRQETFMQVQAAVSARRLERLRGRRIEVLVDEVDDAGTAIARSRGDAPEIDGQVLVRDAADVSPGELLTVTVESSDEHDLFARRD
jgi:ribosomal protein S12 methylthiotransferase